MKHLNKLFIAIFLIAGIHYQTFSQITEDSNLQSDHCESLSILDVRGFSESDCLAKDGFLEIDIKDLVEGKHKYTIVYNTKQGVKTFSGLSGKTLTIEGQEAGAVSDFQVIRESDECTSEMLTQWVTFSNVCDEGSLSRSMSCGTGTTSITSCDGSTVTANQSVLDNDSYFTLIANPTPWINCIAYVDNNCQFANLEGWAFCLNLQLSAPGQFQKYTRTTDFVEIGLTALDVARIEWIFCNADNEGCDINTAAGRTCIQRAIWVVTDNYTGNNSGANLGNLAVQTVTTTGPNTGQTFVGFESPGGNLQNLVLFNESCPENCGSITSLKIYNQATDQQVAAVGSVTNGEVINVSNLPAEYYLVVETTGDIQSVEILLNDVAQTIENELLYTWPNGGATWTGGVGTYNLKAYAYNQNQGIGGLCGQIDVNFSIVDCGPNSIDGLYIYDQVTDAPVIGPIGNGSVIAPDDLPANYYLAVQTNGGIQSMTISVNNVAQGVENFAPFTYPSGGESNNNWNAGTGTYHVVANAYAATNAGGGLCDNLDITFLIGLDTGWDYDCGDGLQIEILPTGANGNSTTTINSAPAGNINRIIAEVIYKGGNPGATIQFVDALGNTYTAIRKAVPGGLSAWSYRSLLPPTASVTYANNNNTASLQSMTLYVERFVNATNASIGIFTNQGGYNNTYNLTLPGIPVSNVPRDLSLQIPISEITLDNRYITITASAGGVTATETRCYNPGDLPSGCCLDVFNFTLPNVPGNVSTIDLVIESTNGQGPATCANNGQSFVISSYIKVDIECQPGNISGQVRDTNGNPIPGVTIQLYADANTDGNPDGPVLLTDVTDSNGNYEFLNVDADDYVVVEIQPAGYISVSDVDGTPDPDGDDGPTPDNNIPVTVSPLENDDDNDFVEQLDNGTVSGSVLDENGNPLPGVTITLVDGDPNTNDPTAVTDNNGIYTFTNVTPGDYTLVQTQPANYTSVSDDDDTPEDANDNDGVVDNMISVTVNAGENDTDNNFVEDADPGSISGNVSDDQGNPISGVTVTLVDGDPNTTDPTDVTDVNGNYSFENVEQGSYTLVETQPDGYTSVSDFDSSTNPNGDSDGDDSGLGPNDEIPVVLTPGENDSDNDFVEDPDQGTITGTVLDDNGNPIEGVVLTLVDGDPNTTDPTVVTNANGEYTFPNVEPGDYTIVQTQPENYDSISDDDESPDDPNDNDGVVDNIINVTVNPGETDADNNFVEDPQTGSVSGNVSDDGGNPIAGVTVTLDDGNPNTTDPIEVTDNNGNYSFDNVEPGVYTVIEMQPANYSSVSDFDSSTDPNGDADGDDSGLGANDEIPVVVTPGESDEDNDFIENPNNGTITGSVLDDNGNPIEGVTLTLNDGDPNTIDPTTTSDENGMYTFPNVVPGDYTIIETQPANYVSVSDDDETPDDANDNDGVVDDAISVTVTPGETDADNNFIEDPVQGAITGNVSDDVGNPISDVIIQLFADTDGDGDPNGLPIDNTTTDVDGNYNFDNVEPGAYVVVETQPANYTSVSDFDESTDPNGDADGDDSAQGPDNNIPVIVMPAESDDDNNFVEDPNTGTISGTVTDDNGNPLEGVTITLDDNDPNTTDPTAVTDLNGAYSFDNVEPGDYTLIETQPDNYTSVSDDDESPEDANDNDGVVDDAISVTVTPGEDDADNNFVEDPNPGTISGNVSDNEGTPLEGVTIQLFEDLNGDMVPDDINAPIATEMTDANGNYLFENIEPSSYIIIETQPAGYDSVSDFDASTDPNGDSDGDDSAEGADDNIPVVLTPGENDADNNFIEDPQPGSISGSVTNTFGNPIPGVTITLDDGNPNTVDPTQVTDANGNYTFDNVEPGDYTLVETQPNNYTDVSDFDNSTDPVNDPDGDDSALGPNNEIPVTVGPNEDDADNDFVEQAVPGSISGFVYEDPNGNGLEPGEGIFGVLITLYEDENKNGNVDPEDDAIDSEFTNQNGFYQFPNVIPGDYIVVETQPVAYNNVQDDDESAPDEGGDLENTNIFNDAIPVTVAPNEADDDNNFIEAVKPGSISGTVYEDLDQNNLPSAGEGIENVLITLYEDENGNGQLDPEDDVITTTFTDANGDYIFEDVAPDDYLVVETQPTDPFPYDNVSDGDASAPDAGNDAINTSQNDDIIPVTVATNEADQDNDFVEILCAELPMIEGDSEFFICDGESVSFTAVDQDVEGLTYTWNFGIGATPQTAVGLGPHTVTYVFTPENSTSGADITILIEKPGCPPKFAQVASVVVSPVPNASIDGSTNALCVGATRSFEPVADFQPGATYAWDFGDSAIPATATGYGPHDVEYTTNGQKTVKLVVNPNFTAIANCPDSSAISFLTVTCLGNITGKVTLESGAPIPSVQILLYEDSNSDGLPDLNANPINQTFTTNQGTYQFVNLLPGNYAIVETQPAGFLSVSDEDISNDNDDVPNTNMTDDIIPATVEPLETDADNNFIEKVQNGSIAGTVYEDLNGNNTHDVDEGIENVVVELFSDNNEDGLPDNATPLESTTTDMLGNYVFPAVSPGSYAIVETQPADYNNVSDGDASSDIDFVSNTNTTDDVIPATVLSGENDVDNDFIESGKDGSISGQVRVDDGTPLENVTITLYEDLNGNGVIEPADDAIADVMTDSDGNYIFPVVSTGDYIVKETQPADYNSVSDGDATPDAGNDAANTNTNDNEIPVTVAANEDDENNDFVETPIASSIGDLVWLDLNGDGLQNGAGEDGIAGVTVLLFKDGDAAGFDITDSNGEYLFTNLQAGNYSVMVQPPANLEATYNEDTGLTNPDNVSAVTLGINDNHLTADFGYKLATATLGDQVWYDANRNGINGDNPDEYFVPGVVVNLYRASDEFLIASDTTDANGNYLFEDLVADTYYAIFSNLPMNTIFVPKSYTGSNETNDSDVNRSTGRTDDIALSPGEDNRDIDAGIQEPKPAIGDPCTCLNNSTTPEDGHFGERVEVTSGPDEIWVVSAQTGMFYLDSPEPPAAPIPVDLGVVFGSQPDPNGEGTIYFYEFIHIDNVGYTITVTNGESNFNLSISNNCGYPVLDESTIPGDTVCISDAPFLTQGIQANVAGDPMMMVDGVVVDVFDPGAFTVGQTVSVEVMFDGVDGPTNGQGCSARTLKGVIVIDDCLGSIIGHIYFDTNGDGIQNKLGADGLEGTSDDEPDLPNIDVLVKNMQGDIVNIVSSDEEGNWKAKVLNPDFYSVDIDETDPDFPQGATQTEGIDPNTNVEVIESQDTDTGNDGYTRCVVIEPFVFLEGSMINPAGGLNYNKEEMRTDLNDLRLLPGQTSVGPIQGLKYQPAGQPYNQAPWNYNGTEGDLFDSFGATDENNAGYPASVTDWVLVHLRETADGPPLCQAAALLNSDGTITFLDDFECCSLNPYIPYYLIIEHRNHLIVMSTDPEPVVGLGKVSFDFRNTDSYIVGVSSIAQKLLGMNVAANPVYAMLGGNGQQALTDAADTDINFDDLSFWSLANNTISVYRAEDYNLNGDVNLNDRTQFLINNSKNTSVPRN